jgi:hypothetical protein
MTKKFMRTLDALPTEEKKQVINQLTRIVAEIEKYKYAFTWTPGLRAHERRSREFDTDITVKLGDDVIEFWSTYHESCRYCYYSKSLTYNENRTNTTRLKNIIAYLQEALSREQAPAEVPTTV